MALDDAPGGRLVAVAIDAAGAAGAQSFTYRVPDRLEPIVAGEAVLVEFGRRQALGIVLGPGLAAPGVATKPLVDRVRGDGPLLPELSMRLAAWITGHYLAPPAIVLRAMLPPGLLERLELVAERRPHSSRGHDSLDGLEGADRDGSLADPEDAAILALLDDGPRVVRRLTAPEGRPALLRRLRTLETAGLVDLDWSLLDAGAAPRYIRIAHFAGGTGASAPNLLRLGPRQRAALDELAAAGSAGIPSSALGVLHGTAVLGALVKRGLATVEVVEAPRRPLADRVPGLRGTRPPGSFLSAEQAAAVEAIGLAIATGDPTPLLLDGVTGGGKTAIYAEALAACLAAGRRGL
ncbi:MAG: primosomal protein, partial [Chloroflexi bacterium]|nr:primosomal protein [Chloroflexota bacterium]